MRVKSVSVHRLSFEMGGGQRNARRTWTQKDIVLVFVETDCGLVGVGEGWTSYASPRALQAMIEDDIAPLVVGQSPEIVTTLRQSCRQACIMSGRYGITAVALSAVEMGLWDLMAKAQEVPLFELLGGKAGPIPVYASAGLYGPGKTAADAGKEMAGYVAEGFTSVKMKVGGAPLEEDIARIAAARDAIGEGISLMVDAHYTMTREEALRFAEAAAPHDVSWLEAPISPTDYKGYRWLAERSPVPLCGNETLCWREPFETLIEAGMRFIMPDVSACGGISESLLIADAAAKAGRLFTLHSSSSIVLFMASLHVALAAKALHSVEFHMLHRWLYELGDDAFAVENGMVTLSARPGLGLSLTPDTLKKAC